MHVRPAATMVLICLAFAASVLAAEPAATPAPASGPAPASEDAAEGAGGNADAQTGKPVAKKKVAKFKAGAELSKTVNK